MSIETSGTSSVLENFSYEKIVDGLACNKNDHCTCIY